jgi:hypothetical protein
MRNSGIIRGHGWAGDVLDEIKECVYKHYLSNLSLGEAPIVLLLLSIYLLYYFKASSRHRHSKLGPEAGSALCSLAQIYRHFQPAHVPVLRACGTRTKLPTFAC